MSVPACEWLESCAEPAIGKAIAFCWWGKDEHLVCARHVYDARSLGMKVAPLQRIILDAAAW